MLGRSRTTLKDVARRANVAPSTVSRAFHARKDLLSEETRSRVLQAAAELKYVPNLLASGLRGTRSRALGVILPSISNPFFANVARGVQDGARAGGFEIFVCSTDDNPELELKALDALYSRRVDGLLVASCGMEPIRYRELLQDNYPLVLMDRLLKRVRCDSVVIDNKAATCQVVSGLVDTGHRRIALLLPRVEGVSSRTDRLDGYREALRDRAIPFDPFLVFEWDRRPETAEHAMRQLWSSASPPSAFCVLNSTLALNVVKAFRYLNVTIPDHVSLVLLDDPEWAELVSPALTAVHQPAYELGFRSATLMLNRIEERAKPIETVYLHSELMHRDSVKIPNETRRFTT